MNNIVSTSKFSKLLRKKKNEGSRSYLIEKIYTAIEQFRYSENPESLGEKKKGKLKEYYAYELTESSRVLYGVERREGKISVILFRICNHKQTYGIN